MVGQATPAGQVLISNGLFTLAQLQQLGGVIGGQPTGGTAPIPLAPPNAVGQAWLKAFDLSLTGLTASETGWRYGPESRYSTYSTSPTSTAQPFLSVRFSTGHRFAHGTTNPQPTALRLGLGSGVNALGSPRVIEFSLKMSF